MLTAKESCFFHYISAEIVNERAGFTETTKKKIQELKSKMLCMMYLDKALQQYSTLKLLQKEQGDSRDTNKENIE